MISEKQLHAIRVLLAMSMALGSSALIGVLLLLLDLGTGPTVAGLLTALAISSVMAVDWTKDLKRLHK